jgi:hypothetical protein
MSDMPQAASAGRDRASEAISRVEDDLPRGGRRTVAITGRLDDAAPSRHLRVVSPAAGAQVSLAARVVHVERRRPPRRPAERLGARPDRIAMWAVMMALALIVVAAMSSHL